jgi:hypothetical protein
MLNVVTLTYQKRYLRAVTAQLNEGSLVCPIGYFVVILRAMLALYYTITVPVCQHLAMNDFEVPYHAYQAVFIQPWPPIIFFDVF